MREYLKETYFFDYSDPGIQSLVAEFKHLPPQKQISGLFLKTRDQWRYNPYVIHTEKQDFRASFVAKNDQGHCIDKSVLLITGLRALGIPARLRLAKVVNHIAVERLTEKLGTHFIAPHGISELYTGGKWVKASNAFNKSLCEKFNVDPLEFDGTEDAVMQSFNRDKRQFMEYVEDYGSFEDVPVAFIVKTFQESYPMLYQQHRGKKKINL
jgi:transglutaminase-like putative cysteine protease